MGELFIFNLGDLMKTYGADTFFETGTGFGFGVQFARIFPFRNIFSVDIVASEIERLRAPFRIDPRVQLFAGRSVDIMRQILPQIPGNIIFWLDAHFPGAHHLLQTYGSENDADIRLPLEQELTLIKQLRPGKRDVILIDDLRIYEKDNFEEGNLSDLGLEKLGKFDSRFLYSIFQETHMSRRILKNTGYLMLLPKPEPASAASSPATV
jgi:hypothetical protein